MPEFEKMLAADETPKPEPRPAWAEAVGEMIWRLACVAALLAMLMVMLGYLHEKHEVVPALGFVSLLGVFVAVSVSYQLVKLAIFQEGKKK